MQPELIDIHSGEIISEGENAYHTTWVTHNSRVSQRMLLNHVKRGDPVIFAEDDKVLISGFLHSIITDDGLKVPAFIVNSNHVHLMLICKRSVRDNIVRKLKGKSTYLYKKHHGIESEFHLCAQKYNSSIIKSDEEYWNVLNYIRTNAEKHAEV